MGNGSDNCFEAAGNALGRFVDGMARAVVDLRVLPDPPHVADELVEASVLAPVELLLDLEDGHGRGDAAIVIGGVVRRRVHRSEEVARVFKAHDLLDHVLAQALPLPRQDLLVW